MSIKVMTRVWDHSRQEGSALLVVLALADRADEDGVCWPGIAYLSERARIQDRQTQRVIQQAEQAGELFVARGVGRKNTNLYFVTTGLSPDSITTVLVERFEIDPQEASDTAIKILEAQKGVLDDTISEEKRCHAGQEKVSPKTPIKPKKVSPKTPDPLILNPSVNTSIKRKNSSRSKREAKPKRNPAEIFQIAQALAHVTGMDFEKNKALLTKEAKTYEMADISKIQRDYGAGGPWYKLDWRGQRGQRPELSQIRSTWNRLSPVQNLGSGLTAAERDGFTPM